MNQLLADAPAFLARLHEARRVQAQQHARDYSAIDARATEYLADAALLAIKDAQECKKDRNFRVVSLATGYGKSTTAVAFMVAAAMTDPDFAAAYVCRERELCEEMADMIDRLSGALTGKPLACVYTSAHSDKADRGNVDYFMEAYGFVPRRRLTYKADLKKARVIVVTHAAWAHEVKKAQDAGIRSFKGKRRLVFVDEQPDLVSIVDVQPAMIQEFHDRVTTARDDSTIVRRLAEIVGAMSEVMSSTGDAYVVPAIFSEEDGPRFAPFLTNASERLAPFVTPGAIEAERRKQIDRMAVVCRFLVASSMSAAFYSRRDKVFWAYEWALEPGPGHVLLDATADLGPVVAFLPGVQRPALAPPAVDYSNLEIIHVPMPKEFTNAKKTLAKATSGRAYAEWIKRVITTVAPAGADVLMGAHLSLFELEFFPAAYDTTKPLGLDGRRVVVNHWGSGIGSNKYKHCTHVFQFNEWYQKRGATIATVHGHRGEAVTDEHLRQAEGRRTSNGDYQPRGVYRSAAENHLLRWAKQQASRGSVRNIDGEGKCGKMTLITTMDIKRLVENLDRLYPGAAMPRTVVIPSTASADPPQAHVRGREGLVRLLLTTVKSLLTSDDIAAMAGIRGSDLSREFRSPRVAAIARGRGWRLTTRKAAGLPGKGAVLVRGVDLPIRGENRSDPKEEKVREASIGSVRDSGRSVGAP